MKGSPYSGGRRRFMRDTFERDGIVTRIQQNGNKIIIVNYGWSGEFEGIDGESMFEKNWLQSVLEKLNLGREAYASFKEWRSEPVCLMITGKWSLQWGTSRGNQKSGQNNALEETVILTAVFGKGGQFKRVGTPELRRFRSHLEIEEHIIFSRWFWLLL